jgi:hypothetical protein
MPDGSSKPPAKPKLAELAAGLSEALDKAEPRARRRRSAEPPQDPPRGPPDDGGGGGGDDGEGNYFHWPDNCPVKPLGIDGKEFLFMDANNVYTRLQARDFGGHGLSALYGEHQLYLDSAWPRTNSKGAILGLDKDRAARSHIAACARKGVFDSDNKIRGVGGWTDMDGRLIWHLGDAVLVVDATGNVEWHPVGPIGDCVYPQGVPQIRPALGRRDQTRVVEAFYQLLQCWHWKRGELDARLQLGWIGCALIGGALRWRPAEWATGGQGTGKSTLHDYVLNPILGGTPSVVQTADATGPGLYQALKNRSTPVVFDELEPDPDSRSRIEATIKLAKISASGARIVRGSPDGTHKEFVARASFLFSSILIPRLEPELAMRICVLDLLALGERQGAEDRHRRHAGRRRGAARAAGRALALVARPARAPPPGAAQQGLQRARRRHLGHPAGDGRPPAVGRAVGRGGAERHLRHVGRPAAAAPRGAGRPGRQRPRAAAADAAHDDGRPLRQGPALAALDAAVDRRQPQRQGREPDRQQRHGP